MTHDDFFEHSHISDDNRQEMAQTIWGQDNVELTTVGIDIGSSTSHLLFAKIALQRQSRELSSRFIVIRRDVVWRSPIMLTPFLSNGTIDSGKLESFIRDCYQGAGLIPDDIESGAVILTGEAIKRKNARAIDELFADQAGKFVCATAGHKLEATLAAHGSGAVGLSRQRGICLLHVDIGGGTTKLALIDKGRVLGVCAFAVGGRLIAKGEENTWNRFDDPAQAAARDIGIEPTLEAISVLSNRQAIADRLATVAIDYIAGAPLDTLGKSLQLTDLLPNNPPPQAISFSGGVAEYIFRRESQDFGDIAVQLAHSVRHAIQSRLHLPVLDPGHGIRATVIGASQFTVQVSGKTIHLPSNGGIPIHNVPVVRIEIGNDASINDVHICELIHAGIDRLDIDDDKPIAIAFSFLGDPEYGRLAALGRGIRSAVAPNGQRRSPVLLTIDGDVGKTLGHLLDHELDFDCPVIAIDGVQLKELDFVDIGSLIDPPGVVPVVIKSLLFS